MKKAPAETYLHDQLTQTLAELALLEQDLRSLCQEPSPVPDACGTDPGGMTACEFTKLLKRAYPLANDHVASACAE